MSRARDISAAVSSSIFANYAAYGQFNMTTGGSFGSGFFKFPLNETSYSKNISLSSGNILFEQTGIYNIVVGTRFGSGGDIWTGVRLFGNSVSVGTSFGTGNIANDAGPLVFNFMARISNIAVSYELQGYRDSGTWGQATPVANAGKALVCTINKVGEL
jgi:hypothetical protein